METGKTTLIIWCYPRKLKTCMPYKPFLFLVCIIEKYLPRDPLYLYTRSWVKNFIALFCHNKKTETKAHQQESKYLSGGTVTQWKITQQ